jgi:hypothetical protein
MSNHEVVRLEKNSSEFFELFAGIAIQYSLSPVSAVLSAGILSGTYFLKNAAFLFASPLSMTGVRPRVIQLPVSSYEMPDEKSHTWFG